MICSSVSVEYDLMRESFDDANDDISNTICFIIPGVS